MSYDTLNDLDIVWGAAAIGRFIGKNRRMTFHLLENGFIPARKVGGTWVASRENLRRFMLNVAVA